MTVRRLCVPGAALCALAATSPARAQAGDLFTDYDSTSVYRQPPGTVLTPSMLPVHEPAPPPFGARGEWVVSGSTGVGGSWQSFDDSAARYGSVTVSPAVDWFIARDLSVGLATGISFSLQRGYGADGSLVDTRSTVVRAGPRIGYALHLGRRVTLWPQATVGFEWDQGSQSVVSGGSSSVAGNPLGYPATTTLGPWLGASLALLVHPIPHVFVGVSPGIFRDFANVHGGPEIGGQQTSFSAGFLLGGWFGGPEPTDDEPPPTPTRLPRFGEAGRFVVSNELTLGGGWRGYSGTTSYTASGGLAAGMDFFVADSFSIGLLAGGDLEAERSVNSTSGGTVDATGSDSYFGLRVGVNLAIGRRLSWWPRAQLSFSSTHTDEKDSATGKELSEGQTATVVSLYAPLLVHPATHFFLGLGPTLARDLQRLITQGDSVGPSAGVQNPSTTVGADAIVGAWF